MHFEDQILSDNFEVKEPRAVSSHNRTTSLGKFHFDPVSRAQASDREVSSVCLLQHCPFRFSRNQTMDPLQLLHVVVILNTLVLLEKHFSEKLTKTNQFFFLPRWQFNFLEINYFSSLLSSTLSLRSDKID